MIDHDKDCPVFRAGRLLESLASGKLGGDAELRALAQQALLGYPRNVGELFDAVDLIVRSRDLAENSEARK